MADRSHEPALRTGLSALFEAEARVSRWRCHEQGLTPPGGPSPGLLSAPDGGAALALAGGLAATGARVACFVDATAGLPLAERLRTLAERRIPLLVHAVVGGTADIESLCAAECLVAVARTPSHALDLALVARRAAESALTPAVIALDLAGVGRSFEAVHLPPADRLSRFLGEASDRVEAPTPAQRMLFGPRRRRVPRWFDPRRPTAHGLELPRPEREAAALGRRVFFDAELPAAVDRAARHYAELTGRDLGPAVLPTARKYDDLLVAQGDAVEFAQALADRTRASRPRIAVLGLTWRRPAAAQALVDAARRAKRVTVLEQTPPPGDVRPPLYREIATRLSAERTQVRSVVHGRLSAGELAAALADADWSERVLGVTPPSTPSRFPRREVMLGQVRRDYPQLSALTRASGEAAAPDLRPAGSYSMALYLRADTWPESAIGELLERLRRQHGEHVRSTVEKVEGALWCVTATLAGTPVTEPGAGVPLDLLLIADPDHVAEWDALKDIRPGGTVVLASPSSAAGVAESLPARWLELARRLPLEMYRVDAGSSETDRLRLLGDTAIALGRGETEELERIELDLPAEAPARPAAGALPLAVRRLGTTGETYDNVARFWGEFDEPRREGLERCVPDPYLALGGVPPCTAGLADNTNRRDTLPVIDAARCDGCGECWIACPDSAIGASAPAGAAWLDGLADAATPGKLRRAHGKIGARIERQAGGEPSGLDAGQVRDAFEWALAKLDLDESERSAAGRHVDAVVERLGVLPLSLTEERGSGGLLALAVNPQSCQGCGICARTCPRSAIDIEPQTAERLDALRRRWSAWEALPPESRHAGETPEHLCDVLMLRPALFSVSGGAESEPGSGARIAVRQVAAVAEQVTRDRVAAHREELERVTERLRAGIRNELARGLDDVDLEQLANVLQPGAGTPIDVGRLAARLDELGESTRIDAPRLHGLVELARRLDEERAERAAEPARAGFGIVVARGAAVEWAARFPRNPFSVPLRVDLSGAAFDTAAGLAEGLLGDRWEQARTLRLARIALEESAPSPPAGQRLAETDRSELSREEAALVPPLLVLVGSDALGGSLLAGLERALETDLPLKVVLLDEADPSSPASDLLLRAVDRRRAFVLSTSIAHPDHLLAGLRGALEFHGPALIRMHAPSPRRHGFPKDRTLERARLAVECRVAPLLRCDPTDGRPVLAGNPEPAPGTPAEWAAGERRYQESEFLAERRGPTDPTVPGPNGEGPASGENSTALERRCLAAWHALRERAAPPPPVPAAATTERDAGSVERLQRRLMELAGYGPRGAS